MGMLQKQGGKTGQCLQLSRATMEVRHEGRLAVRGLDVRGRLAV